MKILVIDDEPIARRLLALPMSRLGHEVYTADGGNEALKLLNAQQFDLILLDLEMRDGDGFLVLDHMKKYRDIRWVPVIVTSSHEQESEVIRALDMGADDYLTKPLNFNFLIYKIKNFQRVLDLQSQNLGLLENITDQKIALEEKLALEFEFSSRIQKTLLFGTVPHSPGGVFTSARAVASQGVNGDFIEVMSIYPGCVDIIVGDVMGKGPLAAILAADVKLQVQRQITNHVIKSAKERFSAADIVNSLHKTLTPKLMELESFVTLQYCRIDRINRRFTVVCCGQPPPYILSSAGVSAFGGQHLPLGILLDELYEEHQCEIDAGSSILSYSDGLTEAKNNQGDAYGESGLAKELALYQTRGIGANALVESIHASVLEFIDARALGDDLTLVAAHVPDDGLNLQCLQLPREIDRITDLRRFIERVAVRQSWPHDLLDKITLVVVEVFTNIVRHSSTMLGNSSLEVLVHDDPTSVWVTIESLGQYFDSVNAQCAPHSTSDLTREGGFGLQIINSLTDDFQYERIGRVNRMKMSFRMGADVTLDKT